MKHFNRFYLLLGIVFFIALLARLAVSFELSANDAQVATPSVYTDMATYQKLAQSVLKGEFEAPFYYQPFYYAVFLPILGIFGAGISQLLIAQAVLGAATAISAGICAALLRGKRAGIICSILLTLAFTPILYTPYMLIATLQAFWISLIALVSLLAMKKHSTVLWGVVGGLCGCAILTRGNIWFFIPGLLVAIILTNRRPTTTTPEKSPSPLMRLVVPMIFLACVILPQIPFAWINSCKLGKLTGPSTAAGNVLALGNTPEAPPGGRNPDFGAGPMEYPDTYQAWTAPNASKSVTKQIMNWILEEPLPFVELTFRKALLFWDHREIPNNISIQQNGAKSRFLFVFGLIPTGLILCLSLAGMLVSAQNIMKKPKYLLTFYFIVSYWVATTAFYILARFRLPILPICAIFAAIFIDSAFRALKKRRFPRLGRHFAPALGFGIFVTFFSYEAYRWGWESSVIRLARPDGVRQEIPGKGLMRLDNGPQSFGGWYPINVKGLKSIKKTFAVAPDEAKGKTAKLEFPLIWKTPGRATFKINGRVVEFSSSRPGIVNAECDIALPSDNTITLSPVALSTELHTFIDIQRDYDRTELNGKTLNGEWVCKLFLR